MKGVTRNSSRSHIAHDNRDLREKAITARDAMKDLAGEATHYASRRVADAQQTAGQWADAARHEASDYGQSLIQLVKENPVKSVAIAAGFGLAAGLILRRR